MKIDWKLLREQKLWLYSAADVAVEGDREVAWGLLELLDHIQVDAVDSGEATEEEVFGPVETAFDADPAEEFDRFEAAMSDRFCREIEE
jgi:hypothetical protein